jgi:uncharacterized membrane protein (DUF485 family)
VTDHRIGEMTTFKQRTGLTLFAIYLIVYGGFVLLNAFAPDVMKLKPIPGVNLAVIYGFALILLAFGLAMIYGVISGRRGTDKSVTDRVPRERQP